MVSGNPAKAVTGTGLGLEFDNIATMSATKVDISSNATLLSLNVTGTTIPTNGIYSPAANQLGFATNSTQRGLITSVGGWTINAPSSGTALTINGVSGSPVGQFVGASSAGGTLQLKDGNAGNQLWNLSSGGTSTGLFSLRDATRGVDVISANTTGNVTIAAPSSGTALTISGLASTTAIAVNATELPAVVINANATVALSLRSYFAGLVGLVGTTSNHGLNLRTNDTDRLTIAAAGNVTISAPSSGDALTVNGTTTLSAPGGYLFLNSTTATTAPLLRLQRATVEKARFGVEGTAGGTITGSAIDDVFVSAFAGGNILLAGAPAIKGSGPVAAALVDMTPDTGSFTMTFTGFTAGVTGTAFWSRVGNLVTLYIPSVTGTSNAATFTATGLPAAIQPARAQTVALPADLSLIDNGTALVNPACSFAASSGTITFWKSGLSGTWTTSGAKGTNANTPIGNTISYLLN